MGINRYQELWCKTYNDFEISELITEAKQDVASEIFAEIEKAHDDCTVIGTNDVGYLQVFKFECS